jgi:hypothetical protein
MKSLISVAIIGILLLSLPAYADDALSILLARSAEAFMWGTIWVLVVEFGYCYYRFKNTSLLRNILFVITANVVTTIMGFYLVILIPDYEIFFTVEGALLRFLIYYVCTVPVEAIILQLFLRRTERLSFLSAFMNSVLFNLLSYIGIVLIFFILPNRYG